MKRTPLRRVTELRRRRGLAKMSAKRRAIAPKRRELVRKLLAERRCEFPLDPDGVAAWGLETETVRITPLQVCGRRGDDVHERLHRSRGGDILDESNCMVVCRRHHDLIHASPRMAIELGVSLHSWD